MDKHPWNCFQLYNIFFSYECSFNHFWKLGTTPLWQLLEAYYFWKPMYCEFLNKHGQRKKKQFYFRCMVNRTGSMIVQGVLKTRFQLDRLLALISIRTSCLLFSHRPHGLCSTTSSSSSSLSSPECSFRTSLIPSVKLFAISLLLFYLLEEWPTGRLQIVLTSEWIWRLSSSWLFGRKKRRLREARD